MDGSSLVVCPVPAFDLGGRAYEVGLELRREGRFFGSVGPGCAYFLGRAAERLVADEPPTGELFAFRRERRGAVAGPEFTCVVRDSPEWVPEGGAFSRGDWRVVRRAVVEAWDGAGRGVRAVLTSAQLARFVADLLDEAGQTGLEPMRPGRDRKNRETSCHERR
ncbi:hypothetical protein LO762_01525 [Actinocorallia sp. API 0066]|uniref:hypothetical protein n=1 Tax=Actinocorallia sp. API 0066 TaxID=2896846 RepID=UPI001E49FBF4|nr:hypothetical protein [Actinocorallia sp. API 0066]MCD0447881.1 hypothetical protein [Actinocorallia sp. API 0066]